MRTLRRSALLLVVLALLSTALARVSNAQQPAENTAVDSDKDGMSDVLEQALLLQFAPTFMVARHDCSGLPAEFTPNRQIPTVKVEDGTIYGQVSSARSATGDLPTAEIHFYHLWRADCGPHAHPLDTEHVAVLVSASDKNLANAKWKALYWYAAAHENTVCDVSQIARASPLHAEEGGPKVFVSPGKHASYLNQKLCQSGCGADKCVDMVALPPGKIINLGEAAHPMNGSVFIASGAWPLIEKMTTTNFPPEPVARLNRMPETDIAWFNRGKHPAQGIIADSNATGQAMAVAGGDTMSSLAKAATSTGVGISLAQDGTGNALQKTCRNTGKALAVTAKHVGEALHLVSKPAKPE
jgi:hypothetical protein